MKALARFGKAFGGYKMIDVPQPMCGPEDVVIEIKAAAICGADMKHYNVDSGSDEFNSIRGHEFAGCIAQVGEKVKDWKVGQRVVSDNSGHVCGVCPACEQGDFLCCTEKVNLGLDNNTWGGGFSKYCLVPGEILKIHRHALWEIPDGVDYEDAAVLDPICNAYKSIAQQSKFWDQCIPKYMLHNNDNLLLTFGSCRLNKILTDDFQNTGSGHSGHHGRTL